MIDALKNLFENNVISEEVKADIEAAWETRVTENRTEVSQQLREEFAQRYEHDKSVMIEAVDKMLTDQLQEEIVQFVEDRKQLAEAKAKLAVRAKQHEGIVNDFIANQLAEEISELHQDKKNLTNKLKQLENFVITALAEEISEFQIDKNDLANTKVRLVREGKEQLNMLKQQFVTRASKIVESTVSKTLKKEIYQLKEDIETARRNDFGRKLFEAYASEYQNSYLNEKSETSKLLQVIEKKEAELAEAKVAAARAKSLVESKTREINTLSESKERQAIMHELLSPLNKEKQVIMTELLESVQTNKLRNSFEKYLPAVVSGGVKQTRSTLTESTEVTGNKKTSSIKGSSEDSNIVDITRLAGIKH